MNIEEAIQSVSLDLFTKTVINMMYTSKYVEEVTASVLKPYGLSTQQYNVLRILKGRKGKPANLCTIQERMIDPSSNTSRLIDKLIKKRLAQRKICPENRRKVEILITAQGLELLEELRPETLNAAQQSVSGLDNNELEQLNLLLDKLREHRDQEH